MERREQGGFPSGCLSGVRLWEGGARLGRERKWGGARGENRSELNLGPTRQGLLNAAGNTVFV